MKAVALIDVAEGGALYLLSMHRLSEDVDLHDLSNCLCHGLSVVLVDSLLFDILFPFRSVGKIGIKQQNISQVSEFNQGVANLSGVSEFKVIKERNVRSGGRNGGQKAICRHKFS